MREALYLILSTVKIKSSTHSHSVLPTHIYTLEHIHVHRDTQGHNLSLYFELLVEEETPLACKNTGLISAENVRLCQESQKIIVAAYVTGMD